MKLGLGIRNVGLSWNHFWSVKIWLKLKVTLKLVTCSDVSPETYFSFRQTIVKMSSPVKYFVHSQNKI